MWLFTAMASFKERSKRHLFNRNDEATLPTFISNCIFPKFTRITYLLRFASLFCNHQFLSFADIACERVKNEWCATIVWVTISLHGETSSQRSLQCHDRTIPYFGAERLKYIWRYLALPLAIKIQTNFPWEQSELKIGDTLMSFSHNTGNMFLPDFRGVCVCVC